MIYERLSVRIAKLRTTIMIDSRLSMDGYRWTTIDERLSIIDYRWTIIDERSSMLVTLQKHWTLPAIFGWRLTRHEASENPWTPSFLSLCPAVPVTSSRIPSPSLFLISIRSCTYTFSTMIIDVQATIIDYIQRSFSINLPKQLYDSSTYNYTAASNNNDYRFYMQWQL